MRAGKEERTAMGRQTSTTERETDQQPPMMPAVIEQAAAPLLLHFVNRQLGQRLTDIEEQAVVDLLAITGGNISQVARMTGISKGEVFNVKHANTAAFLDKRERFKKAMALEAHEIAAEAAAIVRDKIGEASARDAAVTWGIFIDKAAMLAGEGSTITHLVRHQVDQASLDALTERLRAIPQPSNEVIGDADFTVVDAE
jgi:hypothetical protein